ncbi:hypothetical protein AV521_04630 [Streptomyces sp. IMTB 2501]|uniref:hypothetical protein n=1 Tax=Streptomyces sp. IMTB 2501 TaxID=1776340 RepID=UPI00096F0EFE|nr:hypothetical protein [Streptomyces sp. IMTB 2501]OLZ73377.1 hypothetical protein AV521_04630 [Streptomyces sp. IMTB 2501]
MTAKDTGTQVTSTVAVEVRVEGDVDEETVAYLREKVDAVLGRPGVPAVSGAVRIVRAVAHHAERPWSAGAELVVGNTLVVAHAQEATGHELADRLQDRLRRQMNRVLHHKEEARRSATPPPWRGGPTDTGRE